MTVKMIKLELKKAFTTPWFYLSLAVLMLCALMSTVYSIDSYQNIRINGFPHYFENGKMTVNEYYATWNCYQKWIGSELVSLASTLFFTLLPVCAVLPYASAFHQERKVGYLRVMLPQCGKKSYFLAKTMAVFLTGAAVVILITMSFSETCGQTCFLISHCCMFFCTFCWTACLAGCWHCLLSLCPS